MLEYLINHGLKLHLSKYIFFYSHVEYLRYKIYLGGLGFVKNKVEAFASIPGYKDMNWVRNFLGLINYY